MNPLAPQMMALFDGHRNAYGQFKEDGTVREDGKLKGSGVTVRGPISVHLWDDHLAGKKQLGIVPINEDSKCKFGAIDIDEYSIDKEAINAKLKEAKIPMIPFRSKSGGMHLYLFVEDFVPAELIQRKLKEIASYLGYGNAEIFPKQTKIIKDRGDIGQWINMPYFDELKTIRYAMQIEDNHKLSLKNFIAYAGNRVISAKKLEELKLEIPEALKQGPPCLQVLCHTGFPDGTRNQGLFNMGVYAKKVDPDGWKKLVEGFNQQFMVPPLSPQEVLTTIGSLDKKDYNYSCKKQPICSHCNVTVCRTRKYGVGEGSGMPTMGTLTKLECDPAIWFVDVDGQRMELTTKELQNPTLFQEKCLECLSIMPVVPKRVEWAFIVQNLLTNIVSIPMPREATPVGQMFIHLEDFCMNRSQEGEADILLRGLVWNNEHHHHFRLQDFLQFLERKRFQEFGASKISSILRDYGAHHVGVNVRKGKFVNVYKVKQFAVDLEFEPPKQTGDIPY